MAGSFWTKGPEKLLAVLNDKTRPRLALEAAALETQRLILQGFEKSQNPWQAAWGRRKRSYSHPLLIRRGRLVSSWRIKVSGSKATVGTSVPYAEVLHKGRKDMVPRKLIGASPFWRRQIRSAYASKWLHR